jgi:hypothetical protein
MDKTSIGFRMRRTAAAVIIACAWLAGAGPAAYAQTAAVTTPPPNIVVPNYAGVPVGPYGGLESGAYTARADDPSAAWFNPAGLSRATGTQISGSAGLFQLTAVTPDNLSGSGGGSFQQLPNLVGFTAKVGKNLTLGFAALTASSWTQETDAQGINTSATAAQRFAYSADSDYSRRVIALSVGYSNGGPLRLGGGLAIAPVSLSLNGSVSDRIANSSTLTSLLVNSRASGSAVQINPLMGMQYDMSHMRFGALVQTPSFSILKSGVLTQDAELDGGGSSLGASVFDANATFEQHTPWQISGGAAYVGSRGELEFDLHGYTSVAAYSLLSTGQPIVVYSDTLTAAPVVTTKPYAGLTTASKGIVNVAVGGHVKILPEKQWLLHFGVATDRSPVADEDQVFTRVNLTSETVGVSGGLGKLQFSAGVHYSAGTSGDVTVRNLADGRSVTTTVNISSLGFIYSLAYTF